VIARRLQLRVIGDPVIASFSPMAAADSGGQCALLLC
jgi:hypothetical protein